MRERETHGRLLGSTLAVVALLGAATGPTHAAVEIASATDVSYGHVQLSADGLRAVARSHQWDGGINSVRYTDVLAIDLRADCPQGIVRSVTRTGDAEDPSLTLLGETIAYRRDDGSTHRFYTAPFDGSSAPQEVWTDASPAVGSLEISSSGRYLGYWRDTGSAEEVVIVDLEATPPAIVASDSGTEIRVAPQRPMSSETIVYSRTGTDGKLHARRLKADGTISLSEDVSGVEELEVTVTSHLTSAFIGESSGVQNVWIDGAQATFNTDSAATFNSLQVSNGALFSNWAVFISNADLVGANAEGERQVYRVEAQSPFTVEQLTTADPGLLAANAFALASIDDQSGDRLAWSQGNTLFSLNTIRYESLGVTSPTPEVAVEIPRPPFDVVDDTTGTTPALGCRTVANGTECALAVRNAKDATRRLLVVPEWEVDDGLNPATIQPLELIPITLGPSERVTISHLLPGTSSGLTITYRVRATKAAIGQEDFAIGVVTLP